MYGEWQPSPLILVEGEWLLPQRLFMEGGMSASSANPNREGVATSSTSLSGGEWPLPLLIFMEVDDNFLHLLFHRKMATPSPFR